jgi:hypothetical protein
MKPIDSFKMYFSPASVRNNYIRGGDNKDGEDTED